MTKILRIIQVPFWYIVSVLLFTAGCDEPFPSSSEPSDVLVASVEVVVPDTLNAHMDSFTGQWSFDDVLILRVRVRNTYDNLLQGEARVEARADIQSFASIPRMIVIQMSRGNLRKPPIFAGAVAIAPDSSAEFATLWLPIATDKMMVWEGNPYSTDNTGARIYGPITFSIRGEARLFERTQSTRIQETTFTMFFKVY